MLVASKSPRHVEIPGLVAHLNGARKRDANIDQHPPLLSPPHPATAFLVPPPAPCLRSAYTASTLATAEQTPMQAPFDLILF